MSQPDWIGQPICEIGEAYRLTAIKRQNRLTKPQGALGELEHIAVRLAAMQGTNTPVLSEVHISVFAADHGVGEEGVSLFPPAVTAEMVKNFAHGGAAINVLAQQQNARLEVVNVGTLLELGTLPGVISNRIAAGTANMSRQPAMTELQLAEAVQVGYEAAERAQANNADLFIGGDMGIANTTSATALACALLGLPASSLTGPGTGLDTTGIAHKVNVIQQSLALHKSAFPEPWQTMQCLGGFEIAALAGAYLRCAQIGLPVLVDGFICSSAALIASRLNTEAKNWWFYGHTSAEPGHTVILQALHARPLLHLGMRLGEGSGAAVALPLMRSAVALHNRMATFDEADVSESIVEQTIS